MARNILVTGATGKQGGAVLSALLASGATADFDIYAVTRNPSSPAATSLATKAGLKIVQGDLDDPAALFNSVKVPIWGVFSVQTFMGPGHTVATEQRQGTDLVDAAIAHGQVQQFVYASVDRGGPKSDSDPTNIPHFMNKFHIEKHLEKKAQEVGMGYTILRPVCFMEMLTTGFAGKAFSALWRVSLKGKPLQVISVADIGYFGAQAFINPSSPEFANTAITLAGDNLTFDQAAEAFRESSGKTLPTTYDAVAKAYLWAAKDIGTMFKWFGTEGYGADIPALRKLHPAMMSFGDWVQQKSAWRKT